MAWFLIWSKVHIWVPNYHCFHFSSKLPEWQLALGRFYIINFLVQSLLKLWCMHRWFLSCYCDPKCNQHQLLLRNQSLPFLLDELLSPSLHPLSTSHTHSAPLTCLHAEVKEIEECKRNGMSEDTVDQSECLSRHQIISSPLGSQVSTDALLELRHSVIMLLLLPHHDRVLQISICKQQNNAR